MCAKELGLDSGNPLEPNRKWWKGSKWGPTMPDLDTPQEGSVEADLKVRPPKTLISWAGL